MTWVDSRSAALERAGHACQRCGRSKGLFGWRLHVHHKDENRQNNDLSNLEVLCPRCHMREHGARRIARRPPPSLGGTTGREFKALRKKSGVSQESMASQLGVSETLVSLFENEQRTFSAEFTERYRSTLHALWEANQAEVAGALKPKRRRAVA